MISVAMATCDGGDRVDPQVRSILSQLGPDDELVVADARSTDGTPERLESLGDPRIRVLRDFPRGSIPGTFEGALRACRGGTLFLSDQDDVWRPGKVERCLETFDATGAALVVHDARVVDGRGALLADSFLRARGARPGFRANLWKPAYLGCAVALRRSLLEVALPFPAGLPMHDWWLGLLAERRGGVAWLPEPLIDHVRHGANANFDPGASPFGLLDRFRLRVGMLRATARRLRERPR